MTRYEYMKQWRKTPAGQAYKAVQRKREAARNRAIQQLILLHSVQFKELFDEELAKDA